MPHSSVKAGATSRSINIFLQNALSTTGAGLTGLTYNSAGLKAYYSFTGAAATSTAITLANLSTVTSAWTSGGFIQLDATNMPGVYRFDLPNALLASGNGPEVLIYFSGANSLAPTPILVELTGWDNQDAVHGGLSAIPDATAGAAGGLFIAGSNAATTVNFTGNLSGSVGSVTGSVGSVTGSVGSVTGLTTSTIATAVWTDTTSSDFSTTSSPGHILVTQLGGTFTTTGSSVFSTAALANAPTGGSAPTVSQIATAVWTDVTGSDFTVANSIGKSLFTSGVVPGASGGLFVAGSNATTTVNFTGNLSGSVGSVTGNVTGSVGSVTGLSVAQIATAVWQDSTSSDFTTASSIGKCLYIANVAPGAAGGHFIAGSNASTTVNITGSLSGSVGSVTAAVTVGGYSSGEDPASLVLNATASSYDTAGTIGAAINAGGTSSDPWSTLLPGSYSSGTAGYLVGTTIPTQIGSPLQTSAYITPPAVGAIATAVWQDATSTDFTAASSIGKCLYIANVAPGAAGGHFIAGSNAATTVNFTGNLSGSVGSVTDAVTVGSYSSGEDPATLVLNATASSYNTVGTIGHAINSAGTASDPWTTMLPGAYTAGMAGYIVGTSIPDQIGSPLQTSVYTTPPTTVAIASAVWKDTTSSDFSVASSIGRSLFTGGAAPGAAGGLFIAGSNAATTVNFTGNLSGSVGSVTDAVTVGSYSSGQDPATLVLDATASSYNTVGSIGHAINAAGTAADPWTTLLPGSYTTGMAGFIIGSAIPAQIGSPLQTSTYTAPPTPAAIATASATAILANPTFPLATDSSGYAMISQNQAVATSVSGTMTVGGCLNAAMAQAGGAWNWVSEALTVLNTDSTTFRVFTINAPAPTNGAPTSRT